MNLKSEFLLIIVTGGSKSETPLSRLGSHGARLMVCFDCPTVTFFLWRPELCVVLIKLSHAYGTPTPRQ